MPRPTRHTPLPPAETEDAYDALPREHPAYVPFARDIAHELNIACEAAPERLPGGSLPVYGLGAEAVVKLYPACCAEEGPREADVLAALESTPVPAPALRARGQRDGWRYVVMQRLPGRLWSDVDAALTDRDHIGLARQLGRLTASLHATKTPFDWPGRDWSRFEARQRAGAAARQRRLGLETRWVDQIEPFLAASPMPAEPHVLLHTELMRQHVFVQRAERGWTVSGIFDFEPARIGPASYDLASIGLFVAAGDARLMHAFLDGYGLPAADRDSALQRRCMAWALLHQYSHLPWYLKQLPAPAARTLHDLARRWWPLDA